MSSPNLLRGLGLLVVTACFLVRGPNGLTFEDGDFAVIRRELAATTEIAIKDVPLAEFATQLAKKHGIPVRLDASGLKRAGVAPDIRVTANIQGRSLDAALTTVLKGMKLRHLAIGGSVWITDLQSSPMALNRARLARVAPKARVIPQPAQFDQNAAIRQQLVSELQFLVQVKLNLVRSICTPTKEQLRQIREDAGKIVNDLSQPARERNPWLEALSLPPLDPRQEFDQLLAARLESRLSKDIAARYLSEAKKRDANRRQICARNLVVILDQELLLTSEQRGKLSTSLEWNWQNEWSQTIEMCITQGQDYIPSIPDQLIVPYLDEDQRDVWRHMAKIGNVQWGFQNNGLFGMALENTGDEE